MTIDRSAAAVGMPGQHIPGPRNAHGQYMAGRRLPPVLPVQLPQLARSDSRRHAARRTASRRCPRRRAPTARPGPPSYGPAGPGHPSRRPAVPPPKCCPRAPARVRPAHSRRRNTRVARTAPARERRRDAQPRRHRCAAAAEQAPAARVAGPTKTLMSSLSA